MSQDLTGRRFGRLLVLHQVDKVKNRWACLCDCDSEKIINVLASSLTRKRRGTESCGCLHKETVSKLFSKHKASNTAEYSIWCGMKKRCLNSKCKAYKNYGGRGIQVCDRWRDSFENFIEDMGPRPGDNYTLERTNVNGDYTPANCVWLLSEEQPLNKQDSINITYNGKKQNLSLWAEELNIPYTSLYNRLVLQNLSFEEAINVIVPEQPKYTFNGQEYTVQELADLVGMKKGTLYGRLNQYGMTVEEAVSKPLHHVGNYKTR